MLVEFYIIYEISSSLMASYRGVKNSHTVIGVVIGPIVKNLRVENIRPRNWERAGQVLHATHIIFPFTNGKMAGQLSHAARGVISIHG